MRKNETDNRDEVEELLRSAQDKLLLKLSLDSHIASSSLILALSGVNLDADLESRFQALKSSQSSARIVSEVWESNPSPGDDLFARFDALKGKSNPSLKQTVVFPSTEEEDEDEDDQVEKLIQWANDAALKACTDLKNYALGKSIHSYSLKLHFPSDLFVGNSLMAMYCVFGDMGHAQQVFDEMPSLSSVSWTVMISGYANMGDVKTARFFFDEAFEKDKGIWGAMISGYVQNNCFKEGLYLFHLMQMIDIAPDESIFISILPACAHLGALDVGIWIHRYMNRTRMLMLA